MKVNGNPEGISELIKALLAVQHEVKNPIATSENPYFKSKYAPLDQIVDLLRPLLTKKWFDNGARSFIQQFARNLYCYLPVSHEWMLVRVWTCDG